MVKQEEEERWRRRGRRTRMFPFTGKSSAKWLAVTMIFLALKYDQATSSPFIENLNFELLYLMKG